MTPCPSTAAAPPASAQTTNDARRRPLSQGLTSVADRAAATPCPRRRHSPSSRVSGRRVNRGRRRRRCRRCRRRRRRCRRRRRAGRPREKLRRRRAGRPRGATPPFCRSTRPPLACPPCPSLFRRTECPCFVVFDVGVVDFVGRVAATRLRATWSRGGRGAGGQGGHGGGGGGRLKDCEASSCSDPVWVTAAIARALRPLAVVSDSTVGFNVDELAVESVGVAIARRVVFFSTVCAGEQMASTEPGKRDHFWLFFFVSLSGYLIDVVSELLLLLLPVFKVSSTGRTFSRSHYRRRRRCLEASSISVVSVVCARRSMRNTQKGRPKRRTSCPRKRAMNTERERKKTPTRRPPSLGCLLEKKRSERIK